MSGNQIVDNKLKSSDQNFSFSNDNGDVDTHLETENLKIAANDDGSISLSNDLGTVTLVGVDLSVLSDMEFEFDHC